MQSIKRTIMVLCCLMLAAGAAWAADYAKMSNEELSKMRGTMYNASQEEWHAFHTEWWKRLSQMTPQERQQYMGPRHQMGMGKGKGRGMGRGMGCGPCWGPPAAADQAPAAGAPAAPAPGK